MNQHNNNIMRANEHLVSKKASSFQLPYKTLQNYKHTNEGHVPFESTLK